MSGFQMGRYVPYDTFVHKIDPRTKVLALVFMMIAIFMPQTTYVMSFIVGGAILIVGLGLYMYSRMKLKTLLKSILSMWFMILFLLVVYCLTPRESGNIAFMIGDYPIYYEAFLDTGRIVLRLVLMVVFSLILTATTRPLDLTDALEWYFLPFKYIGFPTHIFAMMLSLALRFIPTIMDDVNRIMKAQTSRGVDYQKGSLWSKIRAMVSLIVPLFVSAFVRSDELANAMEGRGYDPNAKRTKYRKLTFSWRDLLTFVLVGGFTALVMYVSITNFDAFLTWGGIKTW